MPRRRRNAADPLSLWAEAVATGIAAGVTLSVRVPQLLAGTMTPAEAARMVGEKAAAAGEGLAAGSAAAMRVAARRMARPAFHGSPHRAMADALEIAAAATRPARRRVKANAARLSKP